MFGPSGAGKTTVLRCLAGLDRPDQGFIRYGDATWFDAERRLMLPPQRRGIGLLFQEHALFPHMRVAGNIAYGLRGPERHKQVQIMIDLLGLSGLEDRYPKQLSGGQQQRVALARAWWSGPGCFCWTSRCPPWTRRCVIRCAWELRRLLAHSRTHPAGDARPRRGPGPG